ncbi:hypothetical protein PF005_g20553 [Phytophthora fragariae]|uniref:Secreted protein n=1 Tax=Phytophthora fragariae TaxID=53985 RepID=A0A6A3X7P9_9STRA|nr:hypothetical protein PF003_g16452 [Phytophthora fragariae]KAE8941195.1 hypothetical protein PF009_g9010 [Phytophthora fragariae]KAE8986373.1 hypothetical protein PF011_g20012 [Phytophthora fragariae]KAE9113539.1 hypothetical protein PF007_g10705 [Phytophthora fragariae]KAE9114276.1 hypothetical protein PF010_g9765 [Phytophthora fragariae]
MCVMVCVAICMYAAGMDCGHAQKYTYTNCLLLMHPRPFCFALKGDQRDVHLALSEAQPSDGLAYNAQGPYEAI